MNYILHYPAFVIHLARSHRESYFKENIKKAGYTNVSVFEAVDGNEITSVNNALDLFQNLSIDKDIRKGELGCLLSHLKVLKHIVDNHIQIATVFEDDICFHPEWNKLCNNYFDLTPNNYDVIFMGNQLDSCRRIDIVTPIITTEPIFCTHAYMITLEGARKLLNTLIQWDYTHFINWDYKSYTGLTAIDVMIKDIQYKSLHGIIQQPFIWYSWNGTKYPCEFNLLPVTEKNCRNTGLVFQNTELTSLIAGSETYETPITEPVISLSYKNNPIESINRSIILKHKSSSSKNKPVKLILHKPDTIPKYRVNIDQTLHSRQFHKMKFHAFTHLSS